MSDPHLKVRLPFLIGKIYFPDLATSFLFQVFLNRPNTNGPGAYFFSGRNSASSYIMQLVCIWPLLLLLLLSHALSAQCPLITHTQITLIIK